MTTKLADTTENLISLLSYAPTTGIPPVLYHWTEAKNAPWIHEEGIQHGVYLTTDDDAAKLNADIPHMQIPLRVTVDTTKLDHTLFGQNETSTEGYANRPEESLAIDGNVFYNGAIPAAAIAGMQKFPAHEPEWAFL